MTENCSIKKKDDDKEKENNINIKEKTLKLGKGNNPVEFNQLIFNLLQTFNLVKTLEDIAIGTRLIVDIPLEYKGGFAKGIYKINENLKTGQKWPTLYKVLENGQREFVTNLPIVEEKFVQGNPFNDIANIYLNIMIQAQLSEVSNMLNDIYKIVERIEEGQKTDRIALVIAGKNQILQAMSLNDEDKKREIAAARTNIITGQSQILLSLKTRINNFEKIESSRVNNIFNKNYYNSINKEYNEIQDYFALYLKATQMLSMSHLLSENLKGAEEVFNIAISEMKAIDFTNLGSIFIIESDDDQFFKNPEKFFLEEKKMLYENIKKYNKIQLEIEVQEFLEAIEDVQEKEFKNG